MSGNFATARETLQGYADRGLFRGLAMVSQSATKEVFDIRWHHNLAINVIVDRDRQVIEFRGLLPNAEADIAMVDALAAFVAGLAADSRPAHRRIRHLRLQMGKPDLGFALTVVDDNYGEGVAQIVSAAQEMYFDFLPSGPYYNYLVAELGVNPDSFIFA